MKIIYSDQPIEKLLNFGEKSIFLAGPTPRSKSVPSWRPEALEILRENKYEGQVLVPEQKISISDLPPMSTEDFDLLYLKQVEWEHYGLEHCNRIVFWVPRRILYMPAFTTNVEFGRYVASGRALYGRPDDAEKCRYLDWLYKKYNYQPIHNNLKSLLSSI